VRGKEGVSLGTCRARASQASRMRVACASQLYNYILRFYLTKELCFKFLKNIIIAKVYI
jgi:hypothetical protein